MTHIYAPEMKQEPVNTLKKYHHQKSWSQPKFVIKKKNYYAKHVSGIT